MSCFARQAAVAQLDDVTTIAFERADYWRRDNPIIAALAGGLGLDNAALNALFRQAAAIP